jgi:glucoamylase
MVLKALEDKTYRGATIASPSIPWGGGPNANEPTISGYHAVWSRDLYQVATAWYAMGDRAAAGRALDYLFLVQQKADGSFPQNSWVDGRPIGGGVQMDQIGLPIVLAYQLGQTDRNTWLRHIKPAADFIIQHGPSTGQDRWEEKPGFSPAAIAAEIAGLVCAAQLARVQGATASANAYLQKADEWAHNIDSWCATNNGPYGDGHYYLRINENRNPNDGAKIEINSGGGTFDERDIVDAGFLELVRLGIKRADDPLILKSLAVVDELAKVETPAGAAWYRYNHDAYGERPDRESYDGRTGKGRLWPLLTGERGEYDLAKGDKARAVQRLNTMLAFANDGMMIPEQVWDGQRSSGSFGSGTGSATPLAWSMAQFIRLAMNIKSGRNLETPQVVAARYLNR